MSGTSKLNLERVIHESTPDIGYVEDDAVGLGEWRLGAGTTIPAIGAGALGVAVAATSLNCIAWAAAGTTTDTIRLDWTIPGQFKSAQVGQGETPVLKLLLKVRTRDTTGSATANTDLALTAQIFMHNAAETSLQTLGTAVSNIVGALDYAAAEEEGFAWYTFDLYGAMSAAQKLLALPLGTLQIIVAPDQVVGTALQIELIGSVIRYRRHAGLESLSAR